MASTIFGVTATDVRKRLNPNNETHLFTYGGTSNISEADVDAAVSEAEDVVAARLPERYRALLTKVDGEILEDYATGSGTETSYTTSLHPVSGLLLYRDYPDEGKPWAARTYEDTLDALSVSYSYVALTGVITLGTALLRGQRLYAEYSHTGAGSCAMLKGIVIILAAVEFARRLPSYEQSWDKYAGWESNAYGHLKRLSLSSDADGSMGIPLFDQMNLVRETRSDSNTGILPVTGGW